MKFWHSFKQISKQEFDMRFFLVNLANVLTWALAVSVSIHYCVHEPRDGSIIGKRIWDQNFAQETAFTIDADMVCVYWTVLFALQLGNLLYHAYLGTNDMKHTAISLHFAVSNLLHSLYLVLFVRSVFGWGELILLLNFINLFVLYSLHHEYVGFTHGPMICGPFAWTIIALYWNGAIMFASEMGTGAKSLEAIGEFLRWGILGLGAFFGIILQDYTMCSLLAYLCASVASAQYVMQHNAQVWISSIVIAAVLTAIAFGLIVKHIWDYWMYWLRRNQEESMQTCCNQAKQESGVC